MSRLLAGAPAPAAVRKILAKCAKRGCSLQQGDVGIMTQRLLIVVALLVTLVGCASSPAQIKLAVDPWVSQPSSALIMRWGQPTATSDMPDGNGKVMTYLYQGATVTN